MGRKTGLNGPSRRDVLKGVAAVPLLSRAALAQPQAPHIAVMGAGAFGGWTALTLLRRGARVTLIDPWGPGNARASSGGETRIIRATYGPEGIYVDMVLQAYERFTALGHDVGETLFHPIGCLWMAGENDDYEKASLIEMSKRGVAHEALSVEEAGKRFPGINFDGISWAIYEPDAGFLEARHICTKVLERFVAEGGDYKRLAARPGDIAGGNLQSIKLSDGSTIAADQYVFACGPWLPQLFPDLVGQLIVPYRAEVFFFGDVAEVDRYSDAVFPVWIDGARLNYGIPGNNYRGFKIGLDPEAAPIVDPTTQDRRSTPELIEKAREYIALRFPGLKDAAYLGGRVCQYSYVPDGHFIIDRHPAAENVVIAGGGSGQGFKHGPPVGELTAGIVLDSRQTPDLFRLSRFG